MTRLNIISATYELLKQFDSDDTSYTQRSFAIRDGEEVLAIFGYAYDNTRIGIFSRIKPEVQNNLKHHRRAVIMAYRYLMNKLKDQPLPVHAVAGEVDGADRLLKHIGFRHADKGVYQWLPPSRS